MIPLAEISAYDAPILIPGTLGCIMFLVILWNQVGELVSRNRQPSRPPNELLGAGHDEHSRRIAHLEDENTKVWGRMESNRVEALAASAEITANLAALKTSIENCTTQMALLTMNLDQIKRK